MTARSRIIGVEYPKLYRARGRVTLDRLTEVGADWIRLINADDERSVGLVGKVRPFDVSSEVYEKCRLY